MFTKKEKDTSKLIDTVFKIASLAKKAKQELGNENVIDATLGSLYDEDNNLVTLNSFFNTYRDLDNSDYAKYSGTFSGNLNYKEAIKKYVIGNNFKNLKERIVATPGGTGAISITISNMLSKDETIIIPNIGWTSYNIMAKENNLNIVQYQMFDENNNFNLTDLKNKILDSLNKQNKALVIINSPLHNPTGYSLTNNEWKELVRFINEDCDNKEVILLNDVAYIDYSYNLDTVKDYFKELDNLNNNALLVICYSCSKTFTIYGMRLGASIILHKDEEVLDSISNAYDKSCRTYWSNSNNGAMTSISNVLNKNYNEFIKEKELYINLLKERSDILLKEAKENELPIYPYKEGFFITIKVDNSIKDKYHQELIKENIFTVQVNEGIRVAVCSLPINKCYGLSKRLKDILDKVKG